MTIFLYRFLDSLQSRWNKLRKKLREKRKWGPEWRDRVRPGRTYTRVVHRSIEIDAGYIFKYEIRPKPGWEWTCPNCREYSIVTESMMPLIIEMWAMDTKRLMDLAASKGRKFTPWPKPTAATAGCPECKFRPGAPE